jgi:xanthine permease XanP
MSDQTLPAWLRIIADSILSIATVSAVLLNLLFRIGIRKTSTATIEMEQESRERLEQMIRQEGKTWGVTTDVVEEANATAKQVLNLIEEGHLADGPLTARINFDEVSFVVDIHYSGDLLRLPANRPHSDLG